MVNSSNPPSYVMSPPQDSYLPVAGPPRWSALAITAFVCSLLGFLGFTAVLGIILGIAGIVVTKNGIRRGRGLAIAAIPISLLLGAIGLLGVLGYAQLGQMTKTGRQVQGILADSGDQAKRIDYFFEHATPEFRDEVNRTRLSEWLAEVSKKHGKLVDLDLSWKPGTLTTSGEHAVLNYPGKFVNGQALVQLHFESKSLTTPLLADVEVDGSSPRGTPKTP